jgi:hypothetical protein
MLIVNQDFRLQGFDVQLFAKPPTCSLPLTAEPASNPSHMRCACPAVKGTIVLLGSVNCTYTFSNVISVKRRGIYDVSVMHK